MAKSCARCLLTKESSEFYVTRSRGRESLASYCKLCAAETARQWTNGNKAKAAENARAYRRRNNALMTLEERAAYREKRAVERRTYLGKMIAAANAGDERARVRLAKQRARQARDARIHRLREYGLSEAGWSDLLHSQGMACACCGSADPRSKRGWHIDHDHVSGVVRGLLCNICNQNLGHLGDTATSVREHCDRFLRYLSTVPERMAAAGLPVPPPAPRTFRPSPVVTFARAGADS